MKLKILLLLSLGLMNAGCMTFITRINGDGFFGEPYIGVQKDYSLMKGEVDEKPPGEVSCLLETMFITGLLAMPFDLAFDTVFFPFDYFSK
jgi:uncharacterized protein YceK